jgi:hypothetical protein
MPAEGLEPQTNGLQTRLRGFRAVTKSARLRHTGNEYFHHPRPFPAKFPRAHARALAGSAGTLQPSPTQRSPLRKAQEVCCAQCPAVGRRPCRALHLTLTPPHEANP